MPFAPAVAAKLYYHTRGEGQPVLMLLPQSTGPQGCTRFIDGLAERHTVIGYDQRGVGQSTASDRPMSMAAQAEDALAVLDDAGASRAHILCHSTGCGIGIALASAQPSRIATICLVNPWTWGDPHLTTMQRLRVAAAQGLAPEPYARFNASLLFPPSYRRQFHEEFEKMALQAKDAPHDPAQIERRLEAILAFDARASLPNINAPTLVVTAPDDQLMPPWFAAEAAELLPNGALLELPSGGHMLPETQADALKTAALEQFAGVVAQPC